MLKQRPNQLQCWCRSKESAPKKLLETTARRFAGGLAAAFGGVQHLTKVLQLAGRLKEIRR